MLDSKGTMRDDLKDVCALFDFYSEKKRSVREVEEFINDLAHGKYCLDSWSAGLGRVGRGTKGGHDLRQKYKKFLRRNLKRMIAMHSRLKKKREQDGF